MDQKNIVDRMDHLQKRLSEWNIDTLLVENPVDLFYLTQLKLSKGRLWVMKGQTTLCVDGRYFDVAKKAAPCPVSLWVKGKEVPQVGRVGFDSCYTSVANLEKLKAESPAASWRPIAQPLLKQRLIKDQHELHLLREAAKITWEGIQHIRSQFAEGISEEELALEFEFFVRKKGAAGLAFDSIIAFGENCAYPHHRTGQKRLKKNEAILIDVGVVYQNYCSDVTRVFFFGEPNPEVVRMLDIVRAADRAARLKVCAGAVVGSIDQAARDVMKQHGVESLFTHGLGHGLGLEAHESPFLRVDGDDQAMALQLNMVITIEPGLYRIGVGGVRYENTGIVTKNGFESLYPD
jgi:Xaa-Pro aminopeptidase